MGIFGGIVVFVIIWWTVIFCVLPLWVRRAEKPVNGHEPGAPEDPRLLQKFLLTTAITCVLWVIAYFIIDSGVISFREMQPIIF